METAHRSKEAAARAAGRVVVELLLAQREVCVKLYQSLGSISLYEMAGRSKRVLRRFTWKVSS